MKEEFTQATAPTEGEVEGFLAPLDPVLLQACAQATQPTAQELRLRPRLRAPRRLPSPAWGVALALALLALWLRPTPSVQVQPSWTVDEAAQILVLQVDPPIIQVSSGLARFDVPSHQTVVVRAGQVEVRASGASFLLDHQPQAVRVEVLAGRAQVLWPEGMSGLGPGQIWLQPAPVASFTGEAAQPVLSTIEAPRTTPPPPVLRALPEAAPRDIARAALTWARLKDRYDMGERDATLLADMDQWLVDNPGSALEEETQVLRLELIAAVMPPRQAAAELEAWLVENPRSPRRLEVLYRLGHVARVGLDDCDRAIRAYQVVAREHDGELGELAHRWLVYCVDSE